MCSDIESTLFASTLIKGDNDKINDFISKAESNSETLRNFFRELLSFSALYQRCVWSNHGVVDHPLIELNALKNLASLRLDFPSRTIVKKSIAICQQSIESKLANYSFNLSDEELNQTLFTQEFIWAFQNGDIEKARIEAMKLSSISDNPSAVIEIIMEIAIMHMDQLGAFVYSVYRSSVFAGSKESHPFINLLLSSLGNRPWSLVKKEKNNFSELSLFLEYVVRNCNISEFNLFSTATRLWNGESVRQANFKQGLCVWARKRFDTLSSLKSNSKSSTISLGQDIVYLLEAGKTDDLSNALIQAQSQNKWSWPTNVVELWIESTKSKNIKFNSLDALQSIARIVKPQLMHLIAERLIDIHGRSV